MLYNLDKDKTKAKRHYISIIREFTKNKYKLSI